MLFATINMMAKEHFSFKVISIWTHSQSSQCVCQFHSPLNPQLSTIDISSCSHKKEGESKKLTFLLFIHLHTNASVIPENRNGCFALTIQTFRHKFP